MSAEATVTMGETSAKLSITKAADPTSNAVVGTEITYTVVVKNEGDVKVNNITLSNIRLAMRKLTDYQGGQYDKRPCRGEGFVTGPVHGVYVEQTRDVQVEGLHVDWGRDAFPNKGENIFFNQPNQ